MKAMSKKPWEETWTAEIHSTSVIINFDDTRSGNCAECFMDAGRAKLAAAAPELYRALEDILYVLRIGPTHLAYEVLRKARGER